MAGTSVGQICLDLIINQNDFKKQMSGITSLAKKTGTVLAAAFSVKKLVDFGKACLELGSDLQEVQNVVDVTFPAMSSKVDDFAREAAASFGLSETMAKQFTGTFGSMSKAFGFTERQAYDMGTTLTGLAGDVASFYNITQDEAYTKLKSVFTGETESLKDLGVVMTQTALDSYALAKGYGKTTKAMSEAEKVALRYAFVQDQLSAATGDFRRTSDGWANQVRVLKLQVDSLKATIGQGLINLFTPVIKVVNTLLEKLHTLADAFKSFTELVTGNNTTETQISATNAGAEQLQGTVSGIGEAAKKTAKEMKSLMGFDELNKLSEKTEASGTSGTNISLPSIDYGTATQDAGNSFLSKIKKQFDDLDFSRLTDSLKGFKEQLIVFGSHLCEGLKWIYDNILVPLAGWTITEAIPRFFETLGNILAILNPIIDAFKPLFEWFWESVLSPLAEWTGGMFIQVWDRINEALGKFANWCRENPGTIQNIAFTIGTFFGAWKIGEFLINAGEFIKKIGGIVSAIGKIPGVIGLAKSALSILTGAFNPVVLIITAAIGIGVLLWKNWDTIKEKAKEVWEFVKKKFQEFKEYITTVFKDAWNNCFDNLKNKFELFKQKVTSIWGDIKAKFQQFDNFFSTVFSRNWSKNFGGLGDVLNGFCQNASNIWESLKKIFNGVTEFISGVFTGDWEKAWNGVKDILKGIWDGIVSVVKSPINSVIGFINGLIDGVTSGINSLIDALNSVNFTIPRWVPGLGGSTFGLGLSNISASKIPYLAGGGYVKRNTPQLAMIGDNRHQGEVVAPEDKMQQMADSAAIKAISALENYIAAMMAGFETVVQAIKEQDNSVVIGDEVIGRAAARYKEKIAVITGGI